jgi:acyl dehydratase
MRRYLEDIAIGERWTSREVTLGEDEIVAYARANDPQPMHIDAAAAAAGPFGGIIASGWQVAALSMQLFIEGGGYGDTPVVGMGIDELRWKKPVRPGDRLHSVREVIETRRSESRPDSGIIRTRVTVVNQRGETVLSMIAVGQIAARNVPSQAGAASQ